MKCFFCGEEVDGGYRNIKFLNILGERVPFHCEMLRDCHNEYLKEIYQAPPQEHQADDTYAILRPRPSND